MKRRIGIVGNIGVGKSTLSNNLGAVMNSVSVYKEDVDSPGIVHDTMALFYKSKASDMKVAKVELANQLCFHLIAVLQDFHSKYSDEQYHIFDRIFPEHVEVFAYSNLDTADYIDLVQFASKMRDTLNVEDYDLIIMLDCEDDENIKRVQQRDRNHENDASNYDYITQLNHIYKSERFERQLMNYGSKIVRIDTTKMSSDEVLEEALKEIEKIK